MPIRFSTGRVVATPAALEELRRAGQSEFTFLRRHVSGDFGEALSAADWAANAEAVCNGDRVLSAYYLATGERLWILTEWNRSSTTLLLPSDY